MASIRGREGRNGNQRAAMDPKNLFLRIDRALRSWMGRFGVPLLRISLGLVFFWFGFLKFFPDLSPAEPLAKKTIELLTLGTVPSALGLKILAAWECAIGLGLGFVDLRPDLPDQVR